MYRLKNGCPCYWNPPSAIATGWICSYSATETWGAENVFKRTFSATGQRREAGAHFERNSAVVGKIPRLLLSYARRVRYHLCLAGALLRLPHRPKTHRRAGHEVRPKEKVVSLSECSSQFTIACCIPGGPCWCVYRTAECLSSGESCDESPGFRVVRRSSGYPNPGS